MKMREISVLMTKGNKSPTIIVGQQGRKTTSCDQTLPPLHLSRRKIRLLARHRKHSEANIVVTDGNEDDLLTYKMVDDVD